MFQLPDKIRSQKRKLVLAAAPMAVVAAWLLWPAEPADPGSRKPVVHEEPAIPLMKTDILHILERNPLGIELEYRPPPPPPLPPPPPPPPAVPPPPPPPAGPVKSVGLKLLGTMAGPIGAAAIIAESGGRSNAYLVGETVAGRQVLKITRKRVLLRNGTGQEYLDLPEDGPEAAPVEAPQMAEAPAPPSFPPPVIYAEPPPGEQSMPVQQVTRDVPRDEVMRNIGNPASFLQQIVAEPYYENSRFAGYYVQEVKEGSYASTLGVRSGDILETVNGDLIDNLQKAFRLIGLVQRAPEMNVAIRRGGERVQMTYRLN